MKGTNFKLESVVWKEGKHYVAQCLNVDISSFGRTKASALKNLKEALELFFEDATVRVVEIGKPEVQLISLQHA